MEHGLLILKGDLKPGQDIKPVLGLDDTVIDFDILANRPRLPERTGSGARSVRRGRPSRCGAEL